MSALSCFNPKEKNEDTVTQYLTIKQNNNTVNTLSLNHLFLPSIVTLSCNSPPLSSTTCHQQHNHIQFTAHLTETLITRAPRTQVQQGLSDSYQLPAQWVCESKGHEHKKGHSLAGSRKLALEENKFVVDSDSLVTPCFVTCGR